MFKVKQKISKVLLACLTALFAVMLAIGGLFAMPNSTVHAANTEIAFNLGADGSASHYDGTSKATYSETVDGYTLSITNGTQFYTGARDAKGNSCLKLGSSKNAGSFKFIVPDDVMSVVISVAGYKNNSAKVSVNNGTTKAISTLSDNAAYTDITVDTSSTKTVSFTTVSGGYRAMVNTIIFIVPIDDAASEIADAVNNVESFMNLSYAYKTTTTMEDLSANVVDVLNRATTGVTNTSYASWSGKTATSSAVYAGQSAGGNSSIQLRSNNSNSGIITTVSGGTAKKISITWQASTESGRTLNVYGKNTAYSAATDLYGSNAGTLIGTIKCGTSTELEIEGDYTYIGLRSASGAMYLTEVQITWEAEGAGDGTLQEVTTYSDSKFVIRCGIDADIENIDGVESFGIRVSTGAKTEYYNVDTANSWTLDAENNVYYVVINLGDIINNAERLSTEFTVQAYVVYGGITYESESTKVHSVVSMVKAYKEAGENVEHLYNYLVSKGLIVEG